MRLTQFSNYAVRVLMYAGVRDLRTPSAVTEIAQAYGISYDHLKKAAAELCRLGYLEAVRGRSGGVRLALHPAEIRIGSVIRRTERDMNVVECFDPETNTCPLAPACQFRRALEEATAAFFAVLDGYTLADLIREPAALSLLLDDHARATQGSGGIRSAPALSATS